MTGSLKIVTIADIPVKVHWTFGLFVLALIYLAYISGFDFSLVGWVALFIIALFTCVVMHEYGHALTARHYGVKTRDIILSPIGGIARLERLPEKPMQEFFIALAGPMVNAGICLVLVPYFMIYSFDGVWELFSRFGTSRNPPTIEDISLHFYPILFLLNILLAVFNLLPAFPMDGGRIFRALLSIRFGRRLATRIAAYLGQAVAIGFIFMGFWGWGFTYIFIGIFVFVTASQEYRMVRMEGILEENRVKDILRRQFTSLSPGDSMQLAIDGMAAGEECNFLVLDEVRREVIGVLHEEFIQEALKNKDHEAPVADYLSGKYEASHPEETLKSIFYKMSEKGYSILPVYEKNELQGVIDVGMMNNFMRVQQKAKS